MGKWVGFRIKLVGALFVVFFAVIVARAFYLQIFEQKKLHARAKQQHQRIIPLNPQRGTIFDAHGEELALSINVDSVYAHPQEVQNVSGAAKALAKALALSPAKVRKKLESGKPFLWLKRQVTPRESERVRALDIAGVGFIQEPRRFYPNSEIGAHMLGFTGVDPKGLEGLELKYDSELLGSGGHLIYERDARGRVLGTGKHTVQGGVNGNSLYLTVDKNLQYIAEKELAAGVKEAEAKAGSIVIIEPHSGKVLAMATHPVFNPNNIRKFRPLQWRNRVVCDTVEPGSTIKVFLMAAAFEEKVVRKKQFINCENGSFSVGGRVIHDSHPYGPIRIEEVLKVSSNIAAAKIGKKLNRERLYSYLSAFGFGSRTGVDLPGEVAGSLRPPSSWYELDLASISFGQGLTATPLQVAMATAAIANGGELMEPILVEKVESPDGRLLHHNEPKVVRRVISKEVADYVRALMTLTTERGGTGTLGVVPGFLVAGKTGTAQKVDPVTGGYSADRRVASFVGIVPAEAPRLVVLVVIDEPQTSPYGGVVAAPVFSRVASQTLAYLRVDPNIEKKQDPFPAVNPEAVAFDAAEPLGEGTVVGDKKKRMPKLFGLSCRQVLQQMEESGLNIKIKGHGVVVEQSPKPGLPISFKRAAWVRLAPAG
ncbi:MAG: transpeptidase family protein [Deltaproteobacteria bacterium]|nr:transpeptidase family protein [Deltaproteobacteria bacterium]